MTNYITVREYAEWLGVSTRRVRTLCKEDRIPGAKQFGTGPTAPWMVPAGVRPLPSKNLGPVPTWEREDERSDNDG